MKKRAETGQWRKATARQTKSRCREKKEPHLSLVFPRYSLLQGFVSFSRPGGGEGEGEGEGRRTRGNEKKAARSAVDAVGVDDDGNTRYCLFVCVFCFCLRCFSVACCYQRTPLSLRLACLQVDKRKRPRKTKVVNDGAPPTHRTKQAGDVKPQ